jgi:hypothetical protein
MQKTLGAALLAVLGATAIFQAHQNAKLREQNRSLQEQEASLVQQVQSFQHERDEATSNYALLIAERRSASNTSASDEQFRELLQLRGAVGVLRRQLAEANQQASEERARQLASEQALSKLAAERAWDQASAQLSGLLTKEQMGRIERALHTP